MAFIGEGHDTEASEWIIRQADQKDKRPLNISIFGGQTDLAQALWKVKSSRSEKEYRNFISKIRVYDINDQDKIFSQIKEQNPGLWYILAKAAPGTDRRQGIYRGIYLGGDESLTSLAWLKENVVENHGPLGKLYPLKTWTDPNPHGVMKEGDTPSWFFFLRNGLNLPESPELGGWGGCFRKDDAGIYRDYSDSPEGKGDPRISVSRWRPDFQNDWACRMDWCVKLPEEVNNHPVVVVNHHRGNDPLRVQSKAGKNVYLDASSTQDVDGDELKFEWMIYPEVADTKNLILTGDRERAFLSLGTDFKEKQVSVLLKITDNGKPALTSYKRILISLP